MTYQKCPICDGKGNCHNEFGIWICTACHGYKIIHTQTGKPPISKSEAKRVKIQAGLPDELNNFLDALKDNPLKNPENI